MKKYDERGNEIYYKDLIGVEEWKEYDENNNLIHYTNSKGFECRYDDKGKVIYIRHPCWTTAQQSDNTPLQ